MNKSYKAYRFEADGRYYAADTLQGEDAMFLYLQEHMLAYPNVKIVDEDEEYIVAEAKDGHIVFPRYLAVIQIREEVRKQTAFDGADLMRRLEGSGIHLNIAAPQNIAQGEQLLDLLFDSYMSRLKPNPNE